MKRNISLVLALSIIISVFSPVYGENLEKDLYETAGAILKDQKILLGTASGDLKLDQGFKREEMVVLLSRLHGEYDLAGKSSRQTKFMDVKDPFYKSYISWSVNKGLIKGSTDTIFGYSRILTVQEYQTALLRALGYTEEAEDWDIVPEKAKKIGIMNGLDKDPKTKTTRGLMAAMTLNALRTNFKGKNISLAEQLNLNIPAAFKVDSKANIVRDTVTILGRTENTGKIKVILKSKENQKTLEKETVIDVDGNFEVEFKGVPSGNYSYYFQNKNQTSKTSDLKVNELPFELSSVVADNLKEIKLNFNKPLDKNFGLYSNNFTTNAGPILSSRLENDNKTVVLTLDKNVEMQNTRKYFVSSQSVRSKSGETTNVKEEFTANDNNHPKVLNAEAIGNKKIKLTLSEPIKYPSPSDFKLDDRRFYGMLEYNNENTLILNLKGTTLKDGRHELVVSPLHDYAGFKSTEEKFIIDVYDDKTSPSIVDADASLDEVILEFDRDIDEESIRLRDIFFYKNSNRRYPTSFKVKSNLLYLEFTGSSTLPEESTTIFISGVRDFFGNQVKDSEVVVKPLVDTSKPKVVDINILDNNKSIEVVYSKKVYGDRKESYSLKDASGNRIPIRDIEGSGRNYKLILSKALPVGSSQLVIKDIEDSADRKNIMDPFEREIQTKDMEIPKITNVSGYGREIMISFSKDMDMQTVTDPSNYLLTFDGQIIYMDRDTIFNPIADNKTIMITLPKTINGKDVNIGDSRNITKMQISGLRSLSGNLIQPQTVNFDRNTTGNAKINKAALIDSETIELEFNQPIVKAYRYDFKFTERNNKNYITDVKVDGSNKLSLKLAYPITTVEDKLEVVNRNEIETILGTGATAESVEVIDQVAPKVDQDSISRGRLDISKNTISIPFTEDLNNDASKLAYLDLNVYDLKNGVLLDSRELTTNISGKKLLITLPSKYKHEDFEVSFKDNPRYIMDKLGNVMESDYNNYITR